VHQQAAYIWNLLPLHRVKKGIAATIFLVLSGCCAKAQNLPQYDNKRKFHFGFTINGSYNSFQVNPSPDFLMIDTLKNIRVQPFYGFGLGAIVDMRLGDQFNLRFLGPNISFAQRNLFYDFDNPALNKKVEIESAYVDFPLELKYKSERHWNTRFYVIAGVKYTYDLSSNKDAPRSLVDPVVALKPNSFSYEFGVGMDLYFPFFKLSPELKFSQSFHNVLVRDDYVYTQALNSLFSRIVTFSFHFE
jgi:hypothetical protein